MKVIAVFLALVGLYFIFVIRGETEKKNAKCTEKAVGTVTSVTPSGSEYDVEIEYMIEEFDKSVTATMKNAPEVGSSIDIYYEPQTWSHLYVEGVSPTGKNDIVTGVIIIAAGAVFFGIGIIMSGKKKGSVREET